MPSVLQELTGEDVTLDFAHVSERVDNWQTRLLALYSDVVAWLPRFDSDQSESVEMHEDLMRAYGVAPISLPILRLQDGPREVARLVPRGLWIIGANGRVDLFTPGAQYILIDTSNYFSKSDWEIAPALDRLEAKPISQAVLEEIIQ